MALYKEYNSGRTGIAGNYWRITEAEADFNSGKYRVIFGLYKDEQARNEGKFPVIYAYCYIAIPESTDILSRELAYAICKSLNIFVEGANVSNLLSDAVDV